MEFLVHNISHSDLIVELSWVRDAPADSSSPATSSSNGSSHGTKSKTHAVVTESGASVPLSLLGRPKFSLFQQTSQAIMDKVEELLRTAPASATHLSSACEDAASALETESPTHASSSDAAHSLHASMLGIEQQPPRQRSGRAKSSPQQRVKARQTQSPVGFKLDEQPIPVATLHDFQIRGGSETFELIAKHWRKVAITAVYFPLVALLLPKWRQVLREFKSERSKQLVYLISGAGIPRNEAHSVHGNSTETTAKLLGLFVQQYYPHVDVIQVHSGSNIFRFDDNVQFMTRELRPRLEAHREALVDRCGDAWKAHFHVTIAYTDGPPARLSALNASLRIYRPSYLHLWQLKTFWHERRLSMRDVDFHSFENIEASPCVPVPDADALTQTLVHEMRVFRDQFLRAEGDGEVGSFWLRKSRKPVLAVLLVEKPDGHGGKTLVVHRGMNCEVSMPTGSLCAERNAIGSALASDPTLQRRSMKMIGVLSLNLGGALTGVTATTTTSRTTLADIPRVGAVAETEVASTSVTVTHEAVDELPVATAAAAAAVQDTIAPPAPLSVTVVSPASSPKRRRLENSNYQSPRKPKRPRTFSCDEDSLAHATAVDNTDRNPLAPCGACKEWLVKIAEANPAFRVVTFENSRCRSVYVNQIM